MKGLKLMGIGLLSFLAFGVANVNAETLEVKDEAALTKCVATDGNTCKLTADIEVANIITIDGNKNIVIDLNNHTIAFAKAKYLNVQSASLEVAGTGEIKENVYYYGPIMVRGNEEGSTSKTKVVIGEGVTLNGWAGLFINQTKKKLENNSEVALNSNMEIVVNGKLYGNHDGSDDGAGIYINGIVKSKTNKVTIGKTAVIDGKNGVGIYAAGYAEWNIEGATIKGAQSGIGIKAGILNLKNTKIISNGEDTTPTEGFSNGINSSGAAIQIESNKGYAGDIEINIDGGTYISEKSVALYEYLDSKTTDTTVKSINIKNGTFTAAAGKKVILISKEFAAKFTKFIETGTFSSDVASYVKDGYVMNKVSDTSYVVARDYKTDVPTVDTTETPKDTTIGVSNSNKVSDVLLDTLTKNTELSNAIAGISVTTSLDITPITPTTNDINKTKKALANKKLTNAKISDFFDITVNVKNASTNAVVGTLPELTDAIELVVALPEDLLTVAKDYKRTYYIVRNHNGVLDVLDTTLSTDKKSISFKSDQFSTYAIAYVDTPITTETISNPQTGDNIVFYVILGLVSICGLGYARKIRQFDF